MKLFAFFVGIISQILFLPKNHFRGKKMLGEIEPWIVSMVFVFVHSDSFAGRLVAAAPGEVTAAPLFLPPDNWFSETKMFMSSVRLGNSAQISVGIEIIDFWGTK